MRAQFRFAAESVSRRLPATTVAQYSGVFRSAVACNRTGHSDQCSSIFSAKRFSNSASVSPSSRVTVGGRRLSIVRAPARARRRSVFMFHPIFASPSQIIPRRRARRFANIVSPSQVLLWHIAFQRSSPSSSVMIAGPLKPSATSRSF